MSRKKRTEKRRTVEEGRGGTTQLPKNGNMKAVLEEGRGKGGLRLENEKKYQH